ncbi:VENN motif pre-toxin domain-containing protein, partial [[Pasteurella] aerogenes]
TQGGVSASVAIYGSGSSVSAQGSRTKANVDYAQVNQQSGFNIKESSTINVEENTHLKGGVINAQGDKANHSLKTGTLTTENIENRSDIKVSSISAGVSSDMTQMATSAMGAALSALGNMSESERSQTQAAISSNINVQITDSEAQKQKTGKTAEETLQSLNRDVANANSKLEKQDLTKAQERQEMAQTIGQISEDWLQFAVGDKLKEADKKRQEADAIEKENPEKATALRAQAQAIEAEYGLGSNLQMGVRAATAALQGLATGNVNQAAVGAASPYLNKLIKEQTGDNKEANLIAHAVLGAVEAHITGNNAAAGAVGALTAEAAAPLIMQTLYGTEKPENLTDSQKQNVANLSQIAAGLSGGLVGDSTGSFVAGAEIGKRAVENNSLLVDAFRANKKANAEQWKQNVREKLGDNTASQVINGLISVIEEGADSALFVSDSAFDAFAVLTTCAIGDSYCSQAKIDLASKNEAVSKALGSLMNGEYWSNVKATAQKAYSGDQQALENFSGMISGLLLPTKVLPNNPKLSDFSKVLPDEINSGGKLDMVGETTNYKTIKVDFNKSIIKGSDESYIVNNLEANANYELSNGTKFKTNNYGYVEEISYSPLDMKMPRDKRQTQVGKEGLPTDVGGHIQACSQGGTCDRYNLFPQDANFNNSAYKIYFENVISKALKEGRTVNVNTKFTRNDPSSSRPDRLEIQFSIDGVKQEKLKFNNEASKND